MLAGNVPAQPLRVQGFRLAALLATAGLFLAHGPAFVTCERNTLGYLADVTQPQGLTLALLGICSAAGLAVLVLILHSIGTFRPAGQPGVFRLSPFRELLWALVPALIVIGLALPSIQPLVANGNAAVAGPAAVAEAAYSCQMGR